MCLRFISEVTILRYNNNIWPATTLIFIHIHSNKLVEKHSNEKEHLEIFCINIVIAFVMIKNKAGYLTRKQKDIIEIL